MSSYLGFEPTKRPDYYFVSYNNEDAERLSPLMKRFNHNNIPLWYDYGIEYGSRWEKEIADHIEGCQAVLLFVTKGIFQKEKSYVKIEYDMATRYFDKAVYTVIMENIQKDDIPNSFLGWWIDLEQKQSLIHGTFASEEIFFQECRKMLKIDTYDNRRDSIMNTYNRLMKNNRQDQANELLFSLLHEKELETKAILIKKLFYQGYAEGKLLLPKDERGIETLSMRRIGEHEIKALARTVFRRAGAGDADVIDIIRDDICIYTIPGLVDASDGVILYDEREDLLYILYSSYPNVKLDHPDHDLKLHSVCVVEDPCGLAVCHDFRNPRLSEICNNN